MIQWLKDKLFDSDFRRKQAFLQQVPLFQGISRHQFGRLFQCLAMRNYETGDILFRQGDVGRALFILESGEVEILQNGGGEKKCLATLKSGDYFGEMSLISEEPRMATAKAKSSVRVFLLYKTDIDKLILDAPRIGAAIMTHLAGLLAVRLKPQASLTAPIRQKNGSSKKKEGLS